MRSYDQLSTHKITRAGQALRTLAKRLPPLLEDPSSDEGAEALAALFRQTFDALTGIDAIDLRRADHASRAQLDRAQNGLRAIYRTATSAQSREVRILMELFEQARTEDALAGQLQSVLARDPAYRQRPDAIVGAADTTPLALMAALYLAVRRTPEER